MNTSITDNLYVNKSISSKYAYGYPPTDILITVFTLSISSIMILICCIVGIVYSYRKPTVSHIVVMSPVISTMNPVYRIENEIRV
jgi:hypothetical protein